MLVRAIMLAVALCGALASAASAQTRIIFDTDFGADADDLGALAMLLNLASRGEVELLAVMNWMTERHAVPAIDAVNRFYGQPDIPIGTRRGGAWDSPWHYSKPIVDRLGSRLAATDVPELYRRIRI